MQDDAFPTNAVNGARVVELLIALIRRFIVEAARQLGHSPTVLLDTYAHVIEDGPMGQIDVQAEVMNARRELASGGT
jgi:hypothetical protein